MRDRRPGTCRPALSITAASISAASRAPSAVADIATSRSSGRSTRCRSQAQRQRQVGLQRALVHLVQDHHRDAVQPGVGLQPPDQQPLGDHLDPRRRRNRRIQPRAEADHAADRLAEQRRHPRRRRAGRQPAGFQHQDRAVAAPAGRPAAPAAPASSSRRPAARPARHFGRLRAVASSAGRASVTGSIGQHAGGLAHSAAICARIRDRGDAMPRLLTAASCSSWLRCWSLPRRALESDAGHQRARRRRRWSPIPTRSRPASRSASACACGWQPGWHTYWRNPGDAGVPPELTSTLPAGRHRRADRVAARRARSPRGR